MCGIVGICNFRSSAPVAEPTVRKMADTLAHRGPDAEGYYCAGPVGLGHRRLSILDLSERGRQPMATPDGRFVLAYNGEIYNYLELRAKLEQEGCRFRTATDTEVLLALFVREGVSGLSHLNGMFAFAVWDAVRQELTLARDRIGIKPLYYGLNADGIAFASEAKALFADPRRGCEPCPAALDAYMTFGYVPGEDTLFRGIRKLLPGESLRVRVGREGAERRTYWHLQYAPNERRSVDQTAAELRVLLLDAVRIHMRSDVPVGVFLSGGLDSSAMVALLAAAGGAAIQTFSVAYREGAGFDETQHARTVADRFATKHRVLYVDPADFCEWIPQYVWHMDEPVTEAAAISLYFIARLLREHVIVALSGEGADELFAGYQIYRYMRWLEGYRCIPGGLRHRVLTPALSWAGGPKVGRYLALAEQPLEQRYLGVHLHEGAGTAGLYTADFAATLPPGGPTSLQPFYAATRGADSLTRMLYADLKAWLVDDLLVKADKMTMATSVELRVPFLDYRVVEYAATIPSDLKIRGGRGKWILRRALERDLPRAILHRPKMGFPTPVAQILRHRGGEYLRDVLLSKRALGRGYFRAERVQEMVEAHLTGRADHHKLLWQLLILEEWHRVFADRTRPEPAGQDVAARPA
jgi:asparagine synthase (glutamine-hydrolysing)